MLRLDEVAFPLPLSELLIDANRCVDEGAFRGLG